MTAPLSVAAAQARILAALTPLRSERVPLAEALGRVLAAPVVSRRTLPPFANSAMDGYAVRAADIAGAAEGSPVRLPVRGESRAGVVPSRRLERGTAMRIMTGAPLPEGADTVVRHEDTDNGRETVAVRVAAAHGTSVRFAGEDMRSGDRVLAPGHRLRAGDLAACAALGEVWLEVGRRPRVAVLSTGDELVEPDREPGPGQIVDSNAVSVAAAVREAGGDPVRLGIARDTVVDLRRHLEEGSRCDLVVSSAGVSVGDHDHVRDVVAEMGRLDLWRVAMRPGKPLAVGNVAGVPFLGLPGNPVSSQVTFELFARATRPHRPRSAARTLEPMEKPEGLETFHRGILEHGRHGELPGVRLTGAQGSGILRSMVLADCLIALPAEGSLVPAGTVVEIIPLS
ncbi:MAG: molybdopterin molybdotransferase MoeA [Chloroflexi bacterium]|nr:MAG: molybdopterin molybdotransferase MoeA [Chloroflexota bacterium]